MVHSLVAQIVLPTDLATKTGVTPKNAKIDGHSGTFKK
jgi:hypothetical protein